MSTIVCSFVRRRWELRDTIGISRGCAPRFCWQRKCRVAQFKNACIDDVMNIDTAVISLAALAHEQRLRIFRLLVRMGPNGLPAGEIAEQVGATPTGASFHLKELDRAGLLHATRVGRYIRYAVHVDGMRKLLSFLAEDCCQGQPEICGSTFRRTRALAGSKGGVK